MQPRVSGKRRNGAFVTWRTQWRQAQDPGAADARQDEGAAKRARGSHTDKLEQVTEYEDKDETVKYVPRGRVAHWDGAAVRLGVDDVVNSKASAPEAKSTVLVGRANPSTAESAMWAARVEEGSDGKARDAMPRTAERCPTRLGRSPARRRRRRQGRHCRR